MHAEGVFLWAGVQVPSLVSKYVKGLDGGVEETPCDVRACTNTATVLGECTYARLRQQLHVTALLCYFQAKV